MSTLPYALSKWPEKTTENKLTTPKNQKIVIKSDSESSLPTSSSGNSPAEIRRKLSLLEEKRAIFQRKYFENSESCNFQDTSGDTIVPAIIESFDPSESEEIQPPNDLNIRRRSRPISVKTFDTFSSTFEGTFDNDTGLGYLGERGDFADGETEVLTTFEGMAHLGETSEMPRRLSADSGVRFCTLLSFNKALRKLFTN